jgi:GDPmannose 4,6-dehydratase
MCLSNIKQLYPTMSRLEIYNLAAQSHVKISFEMPEYTADTDAFGTLKLLEAIRSNKLDEITRFYQASTSELYGKVQETPQKETTPFYPRSPYAVAKLYAYWMCVNYREAYDIFACNGILFNHESPLIPNEYVVQKIIIKAQDIFLKKSNKIFLGNLDVSRDWGWASEYVEIMKKLIDLKNPGDFIVATGVNQKLRNVVKNIFTYYDLDYKKYIYISKNFIRKNEILKISANNAKLVKAINYKPKILIKKIITKMIKKEY